jgi:hypothetical protein
MMMPLPMILCACIVMTVMLGTIVAFVAIVAFVTLVDVMTSS